MVNSSTILMEITMIDLAEIRTSEWAEVAEGWTNNLWATWIWWISSRKWEATTLLTIRWERCEIQCTPTTIPTQPKLSHRSWTPWTCCNIRDRIANLVAEAPDGAWPCKLQLRIVVEGITWTWIICSKTTWEIWKICRWLNQKWSIDHQGHRSLTTRQRWGEMASSHLRAVPTSVTNPSSTVPHHHKAKIEEADKEELRDHLTWRGINQPSTATQNQSNKKAWAAMLSSPKTKANSMTLQWKIKTISSTPLHHLHHP